MGVKNPQKHLRATEKWRDRPPTAAKHAGFNEDLSGGGLTMGLWRMQSSTLLLASTRKTHQKKRAIGATGTRRTMARGVEKD
jgi:hypothetical protein